MNIRIYEYTNIWIYEYINIWMHQYINISIYQYINISIYQYIKRQYRVWTWQWWWDLCNGIIKSCQFSGGQEILKRPGGYREEGYSHRIYQWIRGTYDSSGREYSSCLWLRIYWKNIYFSDIQFAILPKDGHKPGTPYNDASSRPRSGWMPKILFKQTNGKKSLCVLTNVEHKATIPAWRNDLVSTQQEAAEGWTQGIWRRVYASDAKYTRVGPTCAHV